MGFSRHCGQQRGEGTGGTPEDFSAGLGHPEAQVISLLCGAILPSANGDADSQADGVAAVAERGLWIDGNGGNPHRVGCAVFSVIDDGRAGSALKRQVLRKRRNRLPQKYRRDEHAKALEELRDILEKGQSRHDVLTKIRMCGV